MSDPFMLPVEDDPFNFAKYADPYPNYRRVRETTPVYWSQLLGGWVLTRHADVKAALLDKRLSAARTRDAQAAQLSEDLRRELAPEGEQRGRRAQGGVTREKTRRERAYRAPEAGKGTKMYAIVTKMGCNRTQRKYSE